MKRIVFRTIATVGLLGLASLGLTACDTPMATSGDMCAYTVGDGLNGHDAKVGEIYLPNQKFTQHDGEKTMFFPCNSRNLRFENGTTDTDAQGKPIGPLQVYTSTGTSVTVAVRIDWTLNEGKDILKSVFIPWCSKYDCASADPTVRSDNFSTNGWTKGLLGENAVPVLTSSVTDTIQGMDDSVWKDASKKADTASAISAAFMKNIRATMGSTVDLFCGSGESSGWSGAKPGEGNFKCAPVRVTISSIQPTDKSLLDIQAQQAKAAMQKIANEKDLDAAKARYGSSAEQTLSDLDKIKACAESSKECNVYVGTLPTK
jgi:hypothetical protein